MATLYTFNLEHCLDHGHELPGQAFWRGSEIWECTACRSKYAGVECHCELVHECEGAI